MILGVINSKVTVKFSLKGALKILKHRCKNRKYLFFTEREYRGMAERHFKMGV
jgi:hypothetical protein